VDAGGGRFGRPQRSRGACGRRWHLRRERAIRANEVLQVRRQSLDNSRRQVSPPGVRCAVMQDMEVAHRDPYDAVVAELTLPPGFALESKAVSGVGDRVPCAMLMPHGPLARDVQLTLNDGSQLADDLVADVSLFIGRHGEPPRPLTSTRPTARCSQAKTRTDVADGSPRPLTSVVSVDVVRAAQLDLSERRRIGPQGGWSWLRREARPDVKARRASRS
jgi:hypothetical protein